MKKDFAKLGVNIPEILLPGPSVNLNKWAVVACDQYTSQPDYWERVSSFVGDSPSTYHIIFPEIYLGTAGEADRIRRIQQTMLHYLEKDVLVKLEPGFVYVERETHTGTRRGLMVALDLEHYDYSPGSASFIRATEGTVLERIPPRVRIREGAAIETPHVMVLIDDPEGQVIEPLAGRTGNFSKIYQTELMMGGGRINGYLVNDRDSLNKIFHGLNALADRAGFAKKYGVTGRPLLLFAVGDGNHSLATAKAVWENIKTAFKSNLDLNSIADIPDHPARYALVELVNVHDPALVFEPIHRVLFNVNMDNFWPALNAYCASSNSGVDIEYFSGPQVMNDNISAGRCQNSECADHRIGFVNGRSFGVITVKRPRHNLVAGTLQAFLDGFVKDNPAVKVDYIHGTSVVTELGGGEGNIGFYLPPLAKGDLFKTVIVDGVLPRKTFSLGSADDKRYYMECRRIV